MTVSLPNGDRLTPWKPTDGDAKCQRCWRRNPAWWADSDVWNRYTDPFDMREAVLCPTCFLMHVHENTPPDAPYEPVTIYSFI